MTQKGRDIENRYFSDNEGACLEKWTCGRARSFNLHRQEATWSIASSKKRVAWRIALDYTAAPVTISFVVRFGHEVGCWPQSVIGAASSSWLSSASVRSWSGSPRCA